MFKACLNAFAAGATLPLAGWYVAWRSVGHGESALAGLSQLAALVPGKSGEYLRRAMFRWLLPGAGSDTVIGFGALLTSSRTILGNRCYIGPYCVLGEVTLEDDVLLASHVSVINGGRQHGMERIDVAIREQPGVLSPVTIGAGSWIGERAVVMSSVGRHCVVGAGAVVTNPLPDYAIAVGVPARIVRFRDPRAADSAAEFSLAAAAWKTDYSTSAD